MQNFKQKNPPKLPCVSSKNSISETGTSIFCANFSFIPIIFFSLVRNVSSAVYFFTIPHRAFRKSFENSNHLKNIVKYEISNKNNSLKLSWVSSKNSIRETDTSIVYANLSYIPLTFLDLINNIKSTVCFLTIPLKNIFQRF